MGTAVYSVIIFLTTYFVPGWTVLFSLQTEFLLSVLLAVPLGIALWGWQAWVLGWLHVRWASWVYIAAFAVWFVRLAFPHRKPWKTLLPSIRLAWQRDALSLVIVIIGVLAQSLMLWNVFTHLGGLWSSCCGDTNDNTWYASITRALIRSVPPEYPGITGQILHNYHYWSNLVVADVVRVFGVAQLPFQFRYSGALVSLAFGLTIVAFTRAIKGGVALRRWMLLFLYFGGDMIYLIPLIMQRTFGFPGSSLEDGVRFLSNLPRSYAVVLTFAWLSLWLTWRQKLTAPRILLLGLLLASTIGFKVYLGLFLFVGLGFVACYELMKRRTSHLLLLFVSLLLAALVYLPVNAGSGGIYFTGFWRFEDFIVQPGFHLDRLELARRIFGADNKMLKVLFFDLIFFAIYIVAIFGSKLLAVFQSKKSWSLLPLVLHVFLLPAIVVHFILGSFFQQTTGGSNSFNFLVNVFIFLSVYAATAVTAWQDFLKKRSRALATIFILTVLLITLPRAVYEIELLVRRSMDLYPMESAETKAVVDYLRATPKETLIMVRSRYLAADDLGPYMFFLTERPQYLSAPEKLLEQFGADTFDRKRNREVLTHRGRPYAQRLLLKHEKIDYIVLDTQEAVVATKSAYWLTPVVQTVPITLLKVDLTKPQPPPETEHQP